jgi:hypothetical protein
LQTYPWLRPNSIVAKLVLNGRDPSNLKLHQVLNETVLNSRRKLNCTTGILDIFALLHFLCYSYNLKFSYKILQLNQAKIAWIKREMVALSNFGVLQFSFSSELMSCWKHSRLGADRFEQLFYLSWTFLTSSFQKSWSNRTAPIRELNFLEQLLSKELFDQASCFAQIRLEEISLKSLVPERELLEHFSSFGKSCSKKFSSRMGAVRSGQLF